MKKIALLFPGQGSQTIGMGKNLYDNYKIAKELFEQANDVLGFNLKDLCFEGDINELTKTENAQPAILTVSTIAFRVYMEETGISPAYLAGHSLGEFSALTCAGAIDFAEALKIVRMRGQFMQEAAALGTGSMAVITGIGKEIVEEGCRNISDEKYLVVVSNYNSPEQTVISGHSKAVEMLSERLLHRGARVIPLNVSAPFHCSIMQPAALKLQEEMSKYSFHSFKYPVISNITARPYSEPGKIIEYMTQQMVSPVQWTKSMKFIEEQGVSAVIELGSGNVLRNLMKNNATDIHTLSLESRSDRSKVKEFFEERSEQIIAETKYIPTVITKCLTIVVCTKNRNWDNDEYQKGVLEPYRRIKEMQNKLELENLEPTYEQMYEALEMLKTVFITKKTELSEQIERFNEIFDATGVRSILSEFRMPVSN